MPPCHAASSFGTLRNQRSIPRRQRRRFREPPCRPWPRFDLPHLYCFAVIKKRRKKKREHALCRVSTPSSPLAKTPSTPRGAICIGMMMAGMSGVAARCGLLVCRGVRGGPSPPSHIHTSLGGPLQPLLSRRTLAHAGAPSARFARFAPHHFIGRGIYTGGGASAPAMRGWPSMFTNSLQRFGRNRRVILFGKTPRLNITISRVGRSSVLAASGSV